MENFKVRWSALSRRGKLLTVGGLTIAFLVVTAGGTREQRPMSNIPPVAAPAGPTLAPATPSRLVETSAPTPPPEPATKPAPTLVLSTPTPKPSPTVAPTPTSAPDVAAISFGRDYQLSATNVSLVNERSTFRAGREIAWRVELPRSTGSDVVRVTVTDEDGSLVIDSSYTPEAGSNLFYGRTVLATEPGSCVMSYYVDGVLLGEGAFTARKAAAPEPTTKPAPKPTPKPEPKPKPKPGGGNCHPSYPGVCIPPAPPDLDCGDVRFTNFKVKGKDPHGFGGDNDGIGCES